MTPPDKAATRRRPRTSGKLRAVALMLPPALILFSLFVIAPLLNAGYYSLFHWNGYGTPQDFVGLRNYERAFDHSIFWVSVRNTVVLLLVSIFIQMPIALALALAIYRKTPTNAVFRLIFFLPFILAEIAAGLIWSFVFDGNTGLVAEITQALGIPPVFILSNRDWAFYAICLVVVWKYFGFHMMIYIAALQAVPSELIEAARIEGAKRWAVIRHVLIPHIRPAIVVSGFFAVIGSLQLFDLVIPLTNGGPSNQTHTIVSYLYTFGLTRLNIGYGSAVGVILFVAAVIVAVLYQWQLNRERAK
ncbi:carbohydrate ABC transporter permease [Thioclava atlantica]|uniref:ABC transporter permease n=1 Tax=Thioclava atlantica TaxID=1317124 RepID=A0A085TT19_9RHOB|nr:sugar ABC transporter permease [Thioclava atlantica]KFE33866.1 ABC transporter permease [Thioclava atlantica]